MKNKYTKSIKSRLLFTAAVATFTLFSGQFSFAQCTPSTTGPWDYIATFNTTGGFTNISHTSTAMATAGYGDFTAVHSVSQLAGESISFSETYSGNGGHGLNIWIDWNNNQDFELSEKVYASVTMFDTGVNGPLMGSFTVPAATAVGNYRMRVRAQQGTADPSPCGEIAWGEAKDYTMTVVGQPTACVPSTTGPWDYIATFNTTGGITNISHTSTAMATAGYGDFTTEYSISQVSGGAFSFSEIYSGNGGHGFNIWVDWNNNLEFENSEKVYASVTMFDTGANGPLTGSFSVPASAAIGNYRMRVRAQQGTADPSPCGEIAWGEAKDYTMTVVSAPMGVNTAERLLNSVVVYKNDNSIALSSIEVMLTDVSVYDMAGRQIYTQNNINASEFSITGITAGQQVLIVKINTDKGATVRKLVF